MDSTIVRSLHSGERFIETPVALWDERLEARRADETLPWPMPEGHLMFENPEECGCALEHGQLPLFGGY